MTSIFKASVEDAELLSVLGRTTFIESHGKSASEEHIEAYVNLKYTHKALEVELQNPENIFYILYHDKIAIGYSKIILNVPDTNIPFNNVTKLERFYVLQEYHNLKLGWELFNFNVKQSKAQQQVGMWLHTWTENQKAINFYSKAGFKIIGHHDFKITENHYNPNYQMLLIY
jgi:ribosomal protein S18 acetylase RimI-like enzyme